MNADLVLAIVLITSLATLVTCHCSLAFGLIVRHSAQRRGWLLLLPPTAWLAPYWGYRAGLRLRSLAWTGSLIVYLVALLLALLDAPSSEGAASSTSPTPTTESTRLRPWRNRVVLLNG